MQQRQHRTRAVDFSAGYATAPAEGRDDDLTQIVLSFIDSTLSTSLQMVIALRTSTTICSTFRPSTPENSCKAVSRSRLFESRNFAQSEIRKISGHESEALVRRYLKTSGAELAAGDASG